MDFKLDFSLDNYEKRMISDIEVLDYDYEMYVSLLKRTLGGDVEAWLTGKKEEGFRVILGALCTKEGHGSLYKVKFVNDDSDTTIQHFIDCCKNDHLVFETVIHMCKL